MKPTVEEFKQFVKSQEDLEIKWFGKYRGRWYHDGIAIRGKLADGGALVERAKNHGWDFEEWNHQDTLGFDNIMSWNISWFRCYNKPSKVQTKSDKYYAWMQAIEKVRV